MREVMGVGVFVGLGIVTGVLLYNNKKKRDTQKEQCSKVDKEIDLEVREFRCVRDSKYYKMIVDRFNGDSSLATLWMVKNYDYPYNYSQIYNDIRSGKIII